MARQFFPCRGNCPLNNRRIKIPFFEDALSREIDQMFLKDK